MCVLGAAPQGHRHHKALAEKHGVEGGDQKHERGQ